MKSQIFIPNIFQSEALKEIDKAMLENEKAFLIVMPTATGKTYLAAQWFKLQLKKNSKARLLYICHNQDILSQANDKEFANCLSEFDIPRGYYNRSEKNIGQVTFATIQTLMRNLDKLSSDYFDYIIVDEAHHYRAKSFERAIKHFAPKVLLGLTATPYRMDGKSILDVFGKIIYNTSISSGIKNGLLSKIKYYYVDNDIDFSKIKRDSRGNYDEKDLNKKICIKEYDDAIIKEYTETVKQKYNKKKTICFCATVQHAHRMEKLFNDNGINAVALTGKRHSETGKEVTVHDTRRRQIISMFRNGNYDIIFVRDLFNEGMDIPDADCVMMLRPTESSRIFTQQIGRGLRISKGKDYLLNLDFTGNCYKCDINYEVLNDIFDVDIEKEVRNRIRNNNKTEIIIQNIGCEVRLSKRKIDVIRESEEKTVTKERLIENYFNVKNKLGRQPISEDFNKNKVSQFDISSYFREFGGWNKFLEEIGESRKKISKEDLIKNYWDLKDKHPNLKFGTVNKKNGSLFDIKTYIRNFGSWNEFLEEIGEKIECRNVVTDEDLIKNYWNLKDKYPDLTADMVTRKNGSQFDITTYLRHFGKWNKFLKQIGEKCRKITDEDLIKNYWNLKDKYPNLSLDMITKKNGSKFHRVTYVKRFGGWNKFLEKIGEKCREKISKEDLIKNYWDIKHKYPNLTSTMVTRKNGSRFTVNTYIRNFGSWNKFLEEIGDIKKDINIINGITEDGLIENYYNVKKELLNKIPIARDMDAHGRFGYYQYIKMFGSWNKFLSKMGDKTINTHIPEEDLIENYFNVKKELLNKVLTTKDMNTHGRFGHHLYSRRFGSWTKFLEKMGEKINIDEKCKRNITIIPNYTPKNPLPDLTFDKSNKQSRIDANTLLGHKYNGSIDKDNIRHKIIEKIQDGDTVLMLESPELDALKEIEKQGKNPKKIIIPNNYEFDDLATSLKKYNTNLNIEVINTSVLQYLADHSEENLNFLWLDYQGAFSYYARDLDIIFQREIKEMKLILTYNTFDPKKQDDSYYFTNVIGYVLKKLRGKNEILLIEDISQRYKKNMFSVGFDIVPLNRI